MHIWVSETTWGVYSKWWYSLIWGGCIWMILLVFYPTLSGPLDLMLSFQIWNYASHTKIFRNFKKIFKGQQVAGLWPNFIICSLAICSGDLNLLGGRPSWFSFPQEQSWHLINWKSRTLHLSPFFAWWGSVLDQKRMFTIYPQCDWHPEQVHSPVD